MDNPGTDNPRNYTKVTIKYYKKIVSKMKGLATGSLKVVVNSQKKTKNKKKHRNYTFK